MVVLVVGAFDYMPPGKWVIIQGMLNQIFRGCPGLVYFDKFKQPRPLRQISFKERILSDQRVYDIHNGADVAFRGTYDKEQPPLSLEIVGAVRATRSDQIPSEGLYSQIPYGRDDQ